MATKRYGPHNLGIKRPYPKWWEEISCEGFVVIIDSKYLNFTERIELEGSVEDALVILKSYSPDSRISLEYDYYEGGGSSPWIQVRGQREITPADKIVIKKIRALNRKRLADAHQEKADAMAERIAAATELLRKEGIIA